MALYPRNVCNLWGLSFASDNSTPFHNLRCFIYCDMDLIAVMSAHPLAFQVDKGEFFCTLIKELRHSIRWYLALSSKCSTSLKWPEFLCMWYHSNSFVRCRSVVLVSRGRRKFSMDCWFKNCGWQCGAGTTGYAVVKLYKEAVNKHHELQVS